MKDIRITVAVGGVLRHFLEDPTASRYGYDLMQTTGFPSGKLYPILARLRAAGWLESEMESVDPLLVGRPPRRWYRLTGEGVKRARYEMAKLHQDLALKVQPGLLKPVSDSV